MHFNNGPSHTVGIIIQIIYLVLTYVSISWRKIHGTHSSTSQIYVKIGLKFN